MEDLAECTCVSLDVRGILWMCFRKGKSGSTTSSQQSQSPKQESEWYFSSSLSVYSVLTGRFTQLCKIKLHKTGFVCPEF